MAKNHVQPGRNIKLTKASVESDDPILEGKLVGVAQIDTNDNGETVITTKEVWDLKAEAVNDGGNSAIVVGDELYYSSGDDPVINKKKSGVKFGIALEAISSGSSDTINIAVYPGENEIWKTKVYLSDTETLDSAVNEDDGLKIMRYAKATYDFGTEDGAVGAHGTGVSIPNNAIILDGVVDVQETLTDNDDDSATLAISVEGANDIVSAVAISSADPADPWDQGLHDLVPDGAAANMVKTTSEQEITLTVADDEIAVGKLTVLLRYAMTEVNVA